MSVPTLRLPTWATGGGADIVDPGSGKQATGWAEDDQPPAQFFNWWKNNMGQWIEFLDSIKNIQHFSLLANAQLKSLTPQDFWDIAHHVNGNGDDGPLFLILDGNTGDIFSSEMGSGWTKLTGLTMVTPNSLSVDLDDSTSVTWCAVGTSSAIETSTNGGVTWTARTSAITGDLDRVRFGNGLFVCIGNGNEIQTSADGITWTSRTNPVADNLNDVFYSTDESLWMIVGDVGTVLTSTDGITWTDRTSFSSVSTSLRSITFDALSGRWVSAGDAAMQFTSDPTSVSWTNRSGVFGFDSGQSVEALASNGDGTVMALRSGGSLADDLDGIGISHDGGFDWVVQEYDHGEPAGKLRQLLYVNNQWHIVGLSNIGTDGILLQSLRI